MPQRKQYAVLAILAIAVAFTAYATSFASPTTGLQISKSVNRDEVQSDSDDRDITYSIKVTNPACNLPPVDLMLVFDRSDSMVDFDPGPPPQPFTSAKATASAFAKKWDASRDRVGFVAYAENADLRQSLTSNFDAVAASINSLAIGPGTNVYAGLNTAYNHLKSQGRSNVAKVIVIFSDGRANRPYPENTAKQKAIDMAKDIKKAGYRIITIGLGPRADAATMRAIASSQSDYYYAPTGADMEKVYTSINKDLSGTSPNTVITDEIAALLDSMEFISASNGGKLNGTSLQWNLGDLPCGKTADVSFKMRAKKGIVGKVTEINTAQVTNDNNQKVISKEVPVDILGPDLTISVTDNKTITKPGETSTYVITITNVGPGCAKAAELINTIPGELIQDDNSPSDDGQSIGNNKAKWTFDICPGETKQFTVKAAVKDDIPDGYTTVVDNAVVSNDGQVKDAQDTTQIFIDRIPEPNYTLSACTREMNGNLVAVFGYLNKLEIRQQLERSVVNNDITRANTPMVLLPGKVAEAFTAAFGSDIDLTWDTVAKGKTVSITANQDTAKCDPEVPDKTPEDPIPNYPPEERFVGIPRNVRGINTQKSNPPRVNVAKITTPASCRDARVLVIEFNATDSDGTISGAQYSVDGGQTWLPVRNIRGLGTKKAVGLITTNPLTDGSYKVLVRAVDNTNTVGTSRAYAASINCEGIVIESTQFNQSGQLSPLSSSGMVHSLVGVPQYMAIAIAGGPEVAEVIASQQGREISRFQLTYNSHLELWETELRFSTPGFYDLTVSAAEKNGRTTARSTNPVQVVDYGTVVTTQGKAVSDARIQLYYRPNNSTSWQLWNGRVFGQSNPTTGSTFSFVVEPGMYFVEAAHPDYFTSTTQEFSVNEYSLLTGNIAMFSKSDIFNWFASHTQRVIVTPISTNLTKDLQGMLGNQLPAITLQDDKKQILTTKDIVQSRKPTLLITWTDWGTIPAAQLEQVKQLLTNYPELANNYNVLAVGLLEGREENDAVLARGKYNFPIYKPKDQSFYDRMFVISAPQYYFIDDKGVVRSIMVGNYPAATLRALMETTTAPQPDFN